MAPLRACHSPASSGLIAPQYAAVIEQRKSDGHSCQLDFDVSPTPWPLYGVDCPLVLITDEAIKKGKSLEWGVLLGLRTSAWVNRRALRGGSCLKVWRQIDRQRDG